MEKHNLTPFDVRPYSSRKMDDVPNIAHISDD